MMNAATARTLDRKKDSRRRETVLKGGFRVVMVRPGSRLPEHPAAERRQEGPDKSVSMDGHDTERRNAFGHLPASDRLEELDDRLNYLRGKPKEEKQNVEEPEKEERKPVVNMFRGWSPLLDFV